jgi:integrase
MPRKTKKQGWSYSAGEWGRNRVRVFERNDALYLEWRVGSKRERLRLDFLDREKAKQAADKLAADHSLCPPVVAAKPVREPLTLRSLFDMYWEEKSVTKGPTQQKHERRCKEMFVRFWGADRKPHTLARQDWDRFIRERREGRIGRVAIRKRGKQKTGGASDRTIAYDLAYVMGVLNWATVAGDGEGGYLLDRNPFKGFKLPVEKNPNRPLVSDEEYSLLVAAASALGWRQEVLLVLAHETGHRIGAIRQLRWSDVDLAEGLIHWPQTTDKIGMAHTTALTREARAALEKARKHCHTIGKAPVIPAPRDASQPCSRCLVGNWWKAIEAKAELPRAKGRGWHSLRRKFATDLRDAPLSDLLILGGWKNPQTVIRCYQAAPTKHRQLEVLARRQRAAS